ncbi:MAG: UDP-N-acetylglucosamine--N-acetylmuramyl-(pentapeptide) pyrophosphoryl-undecaprenol N-acetylglucosamine transferase [Candidatus Dormibacteria bacterium]
MAVAQTLRIDQPGVSLLCVGRQGRLERDIVGRFGIDLEEIAIRGLDRDQPARNLALPWLLPRAWARARSIIGSFRPTAVLATGGDVSLPVVLAARRAGIPAIVMELNALPGLSTRILSRAAEMVTSAFEETARHLARARVELTGTPVRQEFLREGPPPGSPARRLLVLGGSLGARHLNRSVEDALPELVGELALEVDHSTGSADLSRMLDARDRLSPEVRGRYRPVGFMDAPADAVYAADLVLTRAGGGAIAELTVAGRPGIYVPGVFGGGHQRFNGAAVEAAGAGVVVPDPDLSGARLLRELRALLADPARLSHLAGASRRMGRPDAAARVAALLCSVERAG